MRQLLPVFLCLALLAPAPAAMAQPQQKAEKIDVYNLQQKAYHGDLWTQNYLGYLYLSGVSPYVKTDHKEAYKWFGMAAQSGYSEAQTNLALMYANGQYVKQDFEAAATWLKAAAKQNHKIAQYNLGTYYQTGKGVKQDYKMAATWYTYAAKQNDKNSQYALAQLYLKGEGVTQSDEEAVKWLKYAAQQNHPGAQVLLADLYKEGRAGKGYSPEDLVKLYKSAALAGDAEAAARYGDALVAGEGVEKNETEAAKWYRKAADMAHPEAQYKLGKMYLEGRAVTKKDLKVAWFWFSLAANYDDKRAYRDARDSTALLLKPDELAEAQDSVRQWTPNERPKPKQ
jgi:TPR repeat protein